MTERDKGKDLELDAINQVIEALESLDAVAKSRVLDYVFKRLDLSVPRIPTPSFPEQRPTLPPVVLPPGREMDVRSLAEAKKPKNANEMAAVVAYYLGELAPLNDRKPEIAADDIKKYFKQANFRLPEAAHMTLVHAKNAGYLDAGSEKGRYKLNPVGYNLIAHNLPNRDGGVRKKKKGPKKQRRK